MGRSAYKRAGDDPELVSGLYALQNQLNLKVHQGARSAPVRAAMEMLYHIPEQQGFNEAQKIIASLTTLHPDLVQNLLETCRSVKVKRLFMYMADKEEHIWFNDLDPRRINLGSGKRVIKKDGKLYSKYGITIPRSSEY